MKKVLIPLLMLCFISVASSLCLAQSPVTAIFLRSSGNQTWARQTSPGYRLLDVDLNKGCGSKTNYIYMSYTRDKAMGAPITGITVVEGSTPPPPGYRKDNVDLNQGAGGAYLYVCYTRQPGTPITDLFVSLGSSPMPPGWHKIPIDLNKGAGGDYIYLWYKK